MRYFRIAVHTSHQGTRQRYYEFSDLSEVGQEVAAILADRKVTSVQVAHINQATYIRNTRED